MRLSRPAPATSLPLPTSSKRNPNDPRLQHARRRLRQERPISGRHRRFQPQRLSSNRISRRLHQPGPRLSPDREGRPRARRTSTGISANPNNAAAYLGRGNLLRAHGNYSVRAKRPQPGDPAEPRGRPAYHARGLIYQRQGDHVQAITDFNNAIDRDPFAGAPYQARGQSLIATGKYERGDRGLQRRAERRTPIAGTAGRGLAYATKS